MTYAEKLKDPRWQKKRLEVLQSDDFTCQYCGETKKTLHVHHYVYPKNAEPWDVMPGDLTTLCEDCHTVKHMKSFNVSAQEIYSEIVGFAMLGANGQTVLKAVNELILRNKNG